MRWLDQERPPVTAAALVLSVTALLSVGFTLAGLPSAVLFAALLGGMSHALTSPTELAVPTQAFRTGQALIGVTVGTLVTGRALRSIAADLPVILLVTAGTIGISLAAGRTLALRRDVSPVTGTFALVAGGASGVVAVSRELGADDRVVTVVQYLRVLVVVATLPLVTAVVFRPESGVGSLHPGSGSLAADLTTVGVAVTVGLLLARWTPVPTAALLGPLLVAAVITATGWLGPVGVPVWVQWAGYVLIGVQVGLRFTRSSLRHVVRMLPAVVGLILGVIALSAAMGAVLALVTPVDGLTAYLATTPGGLFAVLATAADSGSQVTYVLAVQVVRLLAILALTPLLARVLHGRAGPGRTPDPTGSG